MGFSHSFKYQKSKDPLDHFFEALNYKKLFNSNFEKIHQSK